MNKNNHYLQGKYLQIKIFSDNSIYTLLKVPMSISIF